MTADDESDWVITSGRYMQTVCDWPPYSARHTSTGLLHVRIGTLRAPGYSAKTRPILAPEVSTIEEAGVKGYDIDYWFVAYAPAKTPQPVVTRIRKAGIEKE